jgi:hypothetical protein
MNDSAQAKLDELRSKTDRQLVSLISNKLDRGLTFARVLESDESSSNWASTGHFAMRAEQALSEATAWLPLLLEARPTDRRRLEFKLARLRSALNRSGTAKVQVAAC